MPTPAVLVKSRFAGSTPNATTSELDFPLVLPPDDPEAHPARSSRVGSR